MTLDIDNPVTGWKATHHENRCGGPAEISIGETPLLRDFHCSVEGQSDQRMVPDMTPRVYHKAGLSIFEAEGHFPSRTALRIHQTTRYGTNYLRMVYDVAWPKGTPMTCPVEIGSCTLPGAWSRVLVVPRGSSPEQCQWQKLDGPLAWDDAPASLLLEREDGTRLEYSLGFDLWRWDYAFGVAAVSRITLEPGDDGLALRHFVSDPPPPPPPSDKPDEEAPPGPVPEGRQYRFCAVVAWLAPGMLPDADTLPETLLPYAEDGRLDPNALRAMDLATQAPALDLASLPAAETFHRLAPDGTRGALCWECDRVITLAKRLVRQLAACGPQGTLVLHGVRPGFCLDARHCDKKGERAHWDLEDILAIAAWIRSQLGPGWRLRVPMTDGWALLPSLAGLDLPNGFEY